MITITCCKCQMSFGMPDHFYQSQKNLCEDGSFCCPAGHRQYFARGESDLDKMRRERDRLAQRIAERDDTIRWHTDRLQEKDRQLAAQKGVVTRIKNRVGRGVCPCCNRTFANLQRHMTSQHKGYACEEAREPSV